MPRPQKPGAPPPKRRSRNGCWNCKRKKIKCDETHPTCSNCAKTGDECDYSVQLKWGGRQKRKKPDEPHGEAHGQQQVLSFDQPVTPDPGWGPNLAGSPPPPPVQRPHSSPLPGLPPPLLGYTTAEYVPALTLPPAQLPLIGDGHALSLASTSPGLSSFATLTCGPSYATVPASGGTAVSIDSPTLPTVFTFDTSYRRPPIRPPRKRVKAEPLGLDLLRVTHTGSPASTSESAFATPRLNSLPSLWSETVSTAATPDRAYSPPSEEGEEDEDQGSESDLMLMSPALRRLSAPTFSASGGGLSPLGSAAKVLSARAPPPLAVLPEPWHSVRCWGVDRGFHDLDLGCNEDDNALSGDSPVIPTDPMFPIDVPIEAGEPPAIFAFGTRRSHGYYNDPVYVVIPDSLAPVPDRLLDNKMNLLYFHHFLNHTARVLVPHDDPQSNPFRTVLPQMAMKNDNLLNLLLAYSAAHRARYLGHPGPRLRIMTFVKDILPYLLHLVKQVVDDPQTVISTADLATAIMMASLEIVSPASLGVVRTDSQASEHSIPWQSHLRLAREIIVHRPGGLRRKHSDDQEDQACAFLWSWFAYLDVLGSLSGGRGQLGPHSSWVFGSGEGESDQNSEDDNQIDCIMGFTPRCVYILAKVAELARTCDALRIDPATNTVRPGWRPDPATAAEAIELREAAERSLSEPARPCRHVHATTNVVKWDRDQMAATNEAYHWAALIHLHRRVLGLPSDHDDVRVPVGKILSCLDRIERGGTAETCLLFPMFTAGCELTNDTARAAILERVRTVEKTGMTQVSGARKLMEKVWREGQPWETLLSTEFIG